MPAQTRSDSHIHTLFRPCLGRMDERTLSNTLTHSWTTHIPCCVVGFIVATRITLARTEKKIVMTTAPYLSGMRTRADFEALATVDGLESIAVQTFYPLTPDEQEQLASAVRYVQTAADFSTDE